MVEKTPPKLIIDKFNIENIPSDTGNSWALNVVNRWDALVQPTDSREKPEIYFPVMRFRRSGGPFNFIAEELSILSKAFSDYQGQIPPEYKRQNGKSDLFPSYLNTTVQIGTRPGESKYIIKGIPDGDANPDDSSKFMDIEITETGNAILVMRDTRRNNQASIEFKTAQNGGKYPIMAEVFTRIAERIARAHANHSA